MHNPQKWNGACSLKEGSMKSKIIKGDNSRQERRLAICFSVIYLLITLSPLIRLVRGWWGGNREEVAIAGEGYNHKILS